MFTSRWPLCLILSLLLVCRAEAADDIFGNIPFSLSFSAGQSVRRNAGNSAFEAFTPSSFTPSALTKTDDTNVTLTLGGTPTTALLQATSLTLGWTGTLANARGGFGADVSSVAATTVFGRAAGTSGAPSFSSSPQFTAIGNLTTNGFVKTGGGVGTLSIDTNTYAAVANTAGQLVTLSNQNGSASTAMRSDAAPALSQAIAPTWTAAHAWKISDATTGALTILTLGHNTSSSTGGLGSAILFQAQDSTTTDQDQARIYSDWTSNVHGSVNSNLRFMIRNTGGALTEKMVLGTAGGLSVGDNTASTGAGVINATTGFTIAGSFASGKFVQGNGTNGVISAFQVPTAIANSGSTWVSDGTNMINHTVPYGVVTSTVDQTATAEQAHVVYTVNANTAAVGTTYRITAWGNIDNNTTAITFTPRLRWGGTGGTQLLATPTIVGTTTVLTNKDWKAVAEVTVRTIGASGSAFCSMIMSNHTAQTSGAYSADQATSGVIGVTIDTTANKDLDLTWTLSATTGTPHVRTLGGYVEIIN